MQNLLKPEVGDLIEYTYSNAPGLIRITRTGLVKMEFTDTYGDAVDHPVTFRWSTWKVHVESTLSDVRYLNRDHTWEV